MLLFLNSKQKQARGKPAIIGLLNPFRCSAYVRVYVNPAMLLWRERGGPRSYCCTSQKKWVFAAPTSHSQSHRKGRLIVGRNLTDRNDAGINSQKVNLHINAPPPPQLCYNGGYYSIPPGSFVSFLPLVYFTVTSGGKISMLFLDFSPWRPPGTVQPLAGAIPPSFQAALLHNCGKLTKEPGGGGVL
jgi:hypothetical protein